MMFQVRGRLVSSHAYAVGTRALFVRKAVWYKRGAPTRKVILFSIHHLLRALTVRADTRYKS